MEGFYSTFKPVGPEHIVPFRELDCLTKELIEEAIKGRSFSYSPYSNFKVGAAFRTRSYQIYNGCNIECRYLSPSTCAERTAITKAISEGHREFIAGAVVAYQEKVLTPPCGVCRQLLFEFAHSDFPLYVTKDEDGKSKNPDDPVLVTSVYQLLPKGFKAPKKPSCQCPPPPEDDDQQIDRNATPKYTGLCTDLGRLYFM